MTPKRLNGNHQAVNMAVASTLRAASGSVLCASMRVPSSQSSVNSRPVDSSGQARGTRTLVDAVEHFAVQRDVLGFAVIVELFAHARADLLADFAGVDRGIEPPADR